MNLSRIGQRAMKVLLLAVLAAAIAAPAAEAGRGHAYGHVRYKGYAPPPRVAYRPVVIERRDNGPAIAGFLGGLVIGAVLSHAAPPPTYVYYDPYCQERFVSLDSYYGHACGHHHPRVIQVVELPSNRCVGTRYWDDGRWYSRESDEDWDY